MSNTFTLTEEEFEQAIEDAERRGFFRASDTFRALLDGLDSQVRLQLKEDKE